MAIRGFENITHELTPFEIEAVVPMMQDELPKHKGKANSITNAELREMILQRFNTKIFEPRIRKVAEFIRQTHLIECLVAWKKGYFIATTPEEMEEWLFTMKQRRNALNATIAAGEKSKKRMTGHTQPNQHKKRKQDPKANQHFIFQ